MSDRDAGETGRLRDAVARVLPALELFIRYESEDRAGRDRDRWRSALDRPLPDRGIGLESLLEQLATTVIRTDYATARPASAVGSRRRPRPDQLSRRSPRPSRGRSAGGSNPSTSSRRWGCAGLRISCVYRFHGRGRSAAAGRRPTSSLSERSVLTRTVGWGWIMLVSVLPANA